MKELEVKVDKFCDLHGIIKGNVDDCPICGRVLNKTTPYIIKRVCDNCGEEIQATPSALEDMEYKCPSCEGGMLRIPETERTAPNFVLDGSWNGKDRSKVIMEKNAQLKRKNAGYEHEQQSIKDKVTQQARERGII